MDQWQGCLWYLLLEMGVQSYNLKFYGLLLLCRLVFPTRRDRMWHGRQILLVRFRVFEASNYSHRNFFFLPWAFSCCKVAIYLVFNSKIVCTVGCGMFICRAVCPVDFIGLRTEPLEHSSLVSVTAQLPRRFLLQMHSAFLAAIAKLRKGTVSIVMPVWLSIRPSAWNNSAPTWQIFMKFAIWVFFEYLTRKFEFPWSPTRITCTLHEDQYKFVIIPR